jgi:hypothetical protein
MSIRYYIRRAWLRRDPRRGARCGDLDCICELCATDGCECAEHLLQMIEWRRESARALTAELRRNPPRLRFTQGMADHARAMELKPRRRRR